MHAITSAEDKNRKYQLKLRWYWYNCILGCTFQIRVSGEDLKSSCTALSIPPFGCTDTLTIQGNIRIFKNLSRAAIFVWVIVCIGKLTTQVNIRRSGNLLRSSFHLNHHTYWYADNTGKYYKILKSLARLFPYQP